ncbi:IclR family transcriptional regulator [Kitasatospora sp. NPDC057500]|uniref:IclR family transcriptional regulator n=1 Tax=Kitasatospora sp. NPDC057500 TaxID=3346151 RepID=UPI0036C1E99E
MGAVDSNGGGQRTAGAVQSLRRAFTVLEAVVDSDDPIGVSELARRSDLPVGTVHRLAQTLHELGYVRKDGHSKYLPGPRLLKLAKNNQKAIAVVAQPYLDQLAKRYGESVAVGTLSGDYVVYLAKTPGSRSIRIYTSLDEPVYPHSSAIGKMLLSGLPDERVRTVLDHTRMPRFTDSTHTDPDGLLAELAAVRERGFAVNEGEQEAGMRCVSVAIPLKGEHLGFSLSAPTLRMSDAVLAETVTGLKRAAVALAAELDGTRGLSQKEIHGK